LKTKYRIPWIAGFRDLWTEKHYYDKCGLSKAIKEGLEIRFLSRADALITANPLVELLGKLHATKNN